MDDYTRFQFNAALRKDTQEENNRIWYWFSRRTGRDGLG